MKLSEFVAETIKELIDGVSTASEYAKDKNALVNPTWRSWIDTAIDFDVAVTTTDIDKSKGGAGIFVAAFGAGFEGQSETQNSSVTRVKFSLIVSLPNTPIPPAR